MNKKPILKLFALVAAMMCSLGASAYDFCIGAIYYNITGSNTVEVTYDSGYNSYRGNVKIPRSVTYNNTTYTVTAIGENAFFNSYDLTSVSIPKTVTMIKEGGISANSLTRVIIPNSVAIIDGFAFCNCDYLTDIIIGNGVTFVGDHAFGFGEVEGPFTYPVQTVLCTAPTPPLFGYMYGWEDWEEGDIPSPFDEMWRAFWTQECLYVPNNSLSRYNSAIGWRLFSDIQSESLYYKNSILENGSLGSISFYNSGDYPWFINNTGGETYAQSGNAGASSSTSTLAATITVQEDAILSFDFKAWGEGASFDQCIFTVDGVQKFSYGARDNVWEYSGVELSAGTHTVTWSYNKDGSVDATGDFFAIDHVKVTKKGLEAYACYTPSNTTLTFYYDDLRSTRQGTTYSLNTVNQDPDWRISSVYSSVKRVVFDPSFADARPTSTYSWFANMESLESISGMEYLNTSEVTDMSYMFGDCGMKSLDLSSFNTSKVTTMGAMFAFCFGLTSLDVSGFNTANVTQMSYMFSDCSSLKSLDLGSFKTSAVTAMDNMFDGCSGLSTIYVSSKWSTASVTTSDNMFKDCTSLVGGQGTTYSSSHTDAAYAHIDGGTANPGYFTDKGPEAYACYTPSNTTLAFYYDKQRSSRTGTTYDLNEGENSPGWVTDELFDDISRVVFDPSFADARPTSTYEWFASMFNIDHIDGLNYLNTSEVTTMKSMFDDCSGLRTADLSGFDTRNVTDMTAMFAFNVVEELDLSSFSTENVTNMSGLFFCCSGLRTIYVGDSWSTSSVTNSEMMFTGCVSLVGAQGTTFDEDHVDAAYAHIDGGTANPGYFTDANAVTEAYAVYTEANTTLTFYYDNLRRSRPGTAYGLNLGSEGMEWHETPYFFTQVVFDPSFADARPTTTSKWFQDMSNVLSITGLEYLNTDSVTDMSCMFNGCLKLSSVDLSHFNTSSVTSMYFMFANCLALTSLDLSSFNTDNVTTLECMFVYCTGLRSVDLIGFTNSRVKRTSNMFEGCYALTTIYADSGWGLPADNYSFAMFNECANLVGGQGTTFDENHTDGEYARIDGGPSNPGYFTAKGGTGLRGDVSDDGDVNIADVSALIDYLLRSNAKGVNLSGADCNRDGLVNIADVSALIDYLLSGNWN